MGRKRKERIDTDQFGAALHEILKEYSEDTFADIKELVTKFSKAGIKELKAVSREKGWGDHTGYDKGWTTRYEEGRYSKQGFIFNKIAGLPHLLEHSHALRNGGRSKEFVHIAPVEEKITDEFLKAVKNDIQRGV